MTNRRDIWPSAKAFFQKLTIIATGIASLLTLASLAVRAFEFIRTIWPPLTQVIGDNLVLFFNTALFSAVIYLLIQVTRLSEKITIGFKDNFTQQLDNNWMYEGDWSVEEANELSVSNSDRGGITRIGALWENYSFRFKTKIINKYSTWIVRATDLDNYFMFQCGEEFITPHRRVVVWEETEGAEGKPLIRPKAGWMFFERTKHNKSLNDWFQVEIRVRGPRIDIYIDGDKVYHSKDLLTIPYGRVGFRNYGDEHAHFKDVEVTIM